jgi:hypothetical protein
MPRPYGPTITALKAIIGIGAQRSQRAGAQADIDRSGDDDLEGLAAALGVEDLQRDPMLLENAAALA